MGNQSLSYSSLEEHLLLWRDLLALANHMWSLVRLGAPGKAREMGRTLGSTLSSSLEVQGLLCAVT